jgi:hypothetical protein
VAGLDQGAGKSIHGNGNTVDARPIGVGKHDDIHSLSIEGWKKIINPDMVYTPAARGTEAA